MSFLSILLFFSAFYFACGRPDATAFAGNYPTEDPDYSVDTSTDPDDNQYDDLVAGFMDTMSELLDIYLMPLMVKLDEDKQQDLKAMAMNGCYSYINFVMMLINENNDDQNGFGKWPRDFDDSDPSEDNSDSLPADEDAESDSDAAEDEMTETDPGTDVTDEPVEDEGCAADYS